MVTTKIFTIIENWGKFGCNKHLATPREEFLTCNIDRSIVCIIIEEKRNCHKKKMAK